MKLKNLSIFVGLLCLAGGGAWSAGQHYFRLNNAQGVLFQPSNISLIAKTGTPEATVTAPVGSIYFRSGGAADQGAYLKHSGTGNTGWAPILAGRQQFIQQTSQVVTGSGAVTFSNGKSFYPLSAASAVTGVTVPNGTVAGQVVILEGSDDTNTVTLSVNGATNIKAANGVTTRALGQYDLLRLMWDGSAWTELGFNNNK